MLCPEDKGHLDPIGIREINLGTPQLFVDDFLVENRFDSHFFSANVPHVAHPPQRLSEPLLIPDKPWEAEYGLSYPGVVFDPEAQLFRLYYTVYHRANQGKSDYPGPYFLCYAQSPDGMHWEKTDLGLFPWGQEKRTNIVLQGKGEVHSAHVHVQGGESGPAQNIGSIPSRFLNGHRMVMYYCDVGHYLATSEDGIHWQEQVHQVIANRIDCFHTMVYDEKRDEFASFLRNKLIFGGLRVPPAFIGNTRMIARLSGPDWWSSWDTMPTSVMIPDQGDARRFYGMPTFRYGEVYWGLLHQFDEDPQSIEVELVFSRNGLDWQRLPGRPCLIPVGAPGAWDNGMILSSDRPIEWGDEWLIYYSGCDRYHDAETHKSCIGLVKVRKEGFVSIRAGAEESYVLTRPLRWPQGRLLLNAAASGGYVQVRVTDLRRNLIPGFDFDDCVSFEGDQVRHQVTWKESHLEALQGQLIRLEFKCKNADLFAFVAA